MDYQVKEVGKYKYIEEGEGEVLLLLHGLFGALSNFRWLVDEFKTKYKVVIPLLPLYEMNIFETTVNGLVRHVYGFTETVKIPSAIVIGNSLGGHIAQLYCLAHPDKVKALVLTGSSGLFENAMGGTFPKRGNYEYIKEKTEYTFYDPKVATKELVDEVFGICNDRGKAIRVISMAKSAIRENLANDLHKIKCPVCLIWGKEDKITPPFVAEEFHKLLPDSEVHWMEQCGHAPMMEKPQEFNTLLQNFLSKLPVSV